MTRNNLNMKLDCLARLTVVSFLRGSAFADAVDSGFESYAFQFAVCPLFQIPVALR